MSTNDIEEYFGKGKIKKLFWLNDFSCNFIKKIIKLKLIFYIFI